MVFKSSLRQTSVSSINGESGIITLTSTGGTVTITTPTSSTINLEVAGASGFVVGPALATDNAIARYNGITGKLIQNSLIIIDDTGYMSGLVGLESIVDSDGSSTPAGHFYDANTGYEVSIVDAANTGYAFFINSGPAYFSGSAEVLSTFTAYNGAVFNESGNAVDFRIEGDTNINAFFVKGSTNNIGLGTPTPLTKLDIRYDATISFPTPGATAYGSIHLVPTTNTNDNSAGFSFGANSAGGGSIQTGSQAGIYVQSSSAYGTKMYFATTNSFATGAQIRMMIDHVGYVGIGTIIPAGPLHIQQPNTNPQYRGLGVTQIQSAGSGGSPGLFLEEAGASNATALTQFGGNFQMWRVSGTGNFAVASFTLNATGDTTLNHNVTIGSTNTNVLQIQTAGQNVGGETRIAFGNSAGAFEQAYLGASFETGTGDGYLVVGTRTANATRTVATFTSAGQLKLINKISNYNNINTTGYGVPALFASGRVTAQTAAATFTSYTVGAADGSFEVSANVLITTSTLFNFTITCAYTDEGNTARVLTLQLSNLAGTLVTALTNAAGAVPYEGVPLFIRCKASTTITIASAGGGTYTTVTYNGEGCVKQIA